MRVTIKRNPYWTIKKLENVNMISKEGILRLHKTLGHVDTHALFQWLDQVNFKVYWQAYKQAIRDCHLYPILKLFSDIKFQL